jgi:hypothetical protein
MGIDKQHIQSLKEMANTVVVEKDTYGSWIVKGEKGRARKTIYRCRDENKNDNVEMWKTQL